MTAAWEIHVRDVVVHAVVTSGELATGLGPAPVEPDLVVTVRLASDELASYRAIVRAMRHDSVELKGSRELLDTFLRVFTLPRTA